MEFVRRVVKGTDLINVVDIPNSMIKGNVEIFIFPIEESKKKVKKKKSLAGFLSKYANTELKDKENSIWFNVAKE